MPEGGPTGEYEKTKMMFNNYITDHEIKTNDEVIECVQEYIYLEQITLGNKFQLFFFVTDT